MTPRVGFLGTGWIGRQRMAAIADTGAVAIAAISDPAPDGIAAARAIAPDARVAGSLDDLLAMDLDGIVIATPSALHAAQSIAALDAGVAVFCQKPLGRDAAEVAAVIAAARRADRLLGVDLSYRHTRAARAIADLVRAGELGDIFAVDLVFHNAYGPDKPWFYDPRQSGGGCVIDLGVHLVDLALWMLDFPDTADVHATLLAGGAPITPDTVEDYAAASFRAGGAAVRLACSWRLHAGRDAVIAASFHGTRGGAALCNVGGSFHDFTADRFDGTGARRLVDPPDAWGGRAAAAWARSLARARGFDPDAERLLDSALVLDRIYDRR